MKSDPEYKTGQKVWFVAENGNICYGIITMITPVNYFYLYTIKMNLNSVGEVTKNCINELDILCDFDTDYMDVIAAAGAHGIAKEIDKRIIETLLQEHPEYKKKDIHESDQGECNGVVKDGVPDYYKEYIEDYFTARMGTVEPDYSIEGLEFDDSVKTDLAFIVGAIKKYCNHKGFYSDLATYLLKTSMHFINDMRKDAEIRERKKLKNNPHWVKDEEDEEVVDMTKASEEEFKEFLKNQNPANIKASIVGGEKDEK
jgi:hypothetical protein